jgi:PIN domain nuclease of toxin-antitoxin system
LAEILNSETNNGVQILPISIQHIIGLDKMPLHHKDPFDRLLISQAITDDLILLSKDSHFVSYQMNCIW